MYDFFISVHDQDLIIELERNKIFRYIDNYKYIFLGFGNVDKLIDSDFENKIVIARNLANNIEYDKCLLDYTGWYALSKNDLIKSDHLIIVQYDCFLFKNFECEIRRTLQQYSDCFINFLPISLTAECFLPDVYARTLKICCEKIYGINIVELARTSIAAGDKFWPSGGCFVCTKKWLDDYINWTDKMRPFLVKDKMAAHNVERSIKFFNIINNIQEVYITDVMEHIYNSDHEQSYVPEDVLVNHKKLFSDYINGNLHRKKAWEDFLHFFYRKRKYNGKKIVSILGINFISDVRNH